MEDCLGVEPRHLAALHALHQERSFRGAAARLGYVQSAVSQQIARLETLVGHRLVERSRGHSRVELTSSGMLLLGHAERVLCQLDAARADLAAIAANSGDTLRIGAFESVATRLLPGVISLLAARRPDLRLAITEAATDMELFAQVERGELDVAFAELPLEPGPFVACELFRDPCVLVLPADDASFVGTRPTVEQIARLSLVGHPNWRLGELVDAHLRACGLEPRYTHSSQSNSAVQAMVANGLGAAIMPRLAIDLDDPGIRAVSLDGLLPDRTLALFWRRDRMHTPSLDAWRDAVLETCAAHVPPKPTELHSPRRRASRPALAPLPAALALEAS